jgi:hypothetical protein
MLSARALLEAASRPRLPAVAHDSPESVMDVAVAALLLVAFLCALTVSPYSSGIAVGALVLVALSGRVGTLAAVALVGVVRLLHPDLVAQGVATAALSWLVLIAAGVRTLPTVRPEDAATLGWFWAFAGWAAVTATFTSALPLVSVMKALMLAWTVTTLFVATRGLERHERARVTTAWTALGLVLSVLSLATLPWPAIAYAIGGTGLQGILWHPQTLAVLIAPFAAASAAQFLLLGRRSLALGCLLASATVLFLTEARTGAIAALAGTLAAILLPARSSAGPDTGKSRKVGAVAAIAGVTVVLLLSLFASPDLATGARDFLLKNSGESSLREAFRQSRGEGIAAQWESFRESPVSGHGFGVNPASRAATQVIEVWDIPISAPTEKGFIFSAALEETGAVGTLLLLVALAALARRAWGTGDVRLWAVFVTCLFTNFGEATLFATGGVGLLLWSMIALAATPPRP